MTLRLVAFSVILNHIAEIRTGYVSVISNSNMPSQGGLYSRLWCTWEVYNAKLNNVKLLIHPRHGTEADLFGFTRPYSSKNGRCGNPNDPTMSVDEVLIRKTIEKSIGWADIDAKIVESSRWTVLEGNFEATGYKIGPVGISMMLPHLANFRFFDLDGNEIGDMGTMVLADALLTHKTLEFLSLRENQISDAGAEALSELLKANTKLLALLLAGNQIGHQGVQALADALAVNTMLSRLNLSYNQIGDPGAEAVAESLKSNDTLVQLDVRSNKIGFYGELALRKAQRDKLVFELEM